MTDNISNDEEHEAALARLEQIMGAEPGSPEYTELDQLADRIATYEEARWPITDDERDRRCDRIRDAAFRAALSEIPADPSKFGDEDFHDLLSGVSGALCLVLSAGGCPRAEVKNYGHVLLPLYDQALRDKAIDPTP